jgi:hypothetical protein
VTDRDKRRPHTPPAGVAAQIAGPVTEADAGAGAGENWDDARTGVTPVRAQTENETPTETLLRRTAQTKNTTLDLQLAVDTLHGRVDAVETKLGQVNEQLVVHRDQNSTIISMQADMIGILKSKFQVEAEVAVATAKVTAAGALADTEVKKADRLATVEIKREAWKRALAIAGVIGLAVAGAIAAYLKGCG